MKEKHKWPGPSKCGLNSQSPDSHLHKRPCTSAVSCLMGMFTCGIHCKFLDDGTAILIFRFFVEFEVLFFVTLPNLCKRRGSSASPFSIPNSCYMKTIERPAKKMRKQELPPNSGSSDPLGSEKGSQGEQATTTSGKANSRDSPPSSSRPRRRKFQLVPSRRGIPLIMPEAPMLGYTITVEEYEQVQTEWLKTVFKDKTGCDPFPSEKEQDQKQEKDLTSLAVTQDQDLQPGKSC
ncbi:Nuclear envelope pore membrane protein POM 121C [Manis javanica]|nr:Nuclear envelope pore membrane protein POM 121C [Manis javanica]